MKDRRIGGLIVLIGAAIALLGTAPALSSTQTTGYYSVCNVTSQSGLVITGCTGQLIQGSGSTGEALAQISVNGGCVTSFVFTFQWSNGQTNIVSSGSNFESFTTFPSSVTLSWTVTSGSTQAAGNMTIYSSSGTTTFNDSFTNIVSTCSTSTTSTTSSTTLQGAPTRGSVDPAAVTVGAIVAALGVVWLRKSR